jgi:aspartyl-tRNA(Asn)/glutamyl-tRNA(Gln) amidotransferase subunit A
VLTCRRRRLRSGATTAEAATSQYLARIDALDGRYGAFEYVDREGALASARELDARLAGGGGEDLGPLMGVPVAVKDLCVVEGMPLTAGSSLPPEVLREIVTGGGAEGSVVRSLRYDVRGMASSLARLRVAGRCSIRVVALREACACHARC